MHYEFVNRRLLSLIFALLSACTLAAAPLKLDTLKVGSKTFYKVTTIGANATDLYFTHTKGISNVKLRLLPHYDMLQNELTAKAQKKIRKAKEEAQSSENNFADPISDRSLIGRTAPKLEVEKWMGEKPFTAGKNVLVFFWATWSKPCLKEVPFLNALQKKYNDRLVIVGISSQSEEDVREYNGPTMEFPHAVEADGKLANLVGATSVPYSILVGTNGVVIYQGHPDALTEAKLEKVLTQPPEQ